MGKGGSLCLKIGLCWWGGWETTVCLRYTLDTQKIQITHSRVFPQVLRSLVGLLSSSLHLSGTSYTYFMYNVQVLWLYLVVETRRSASTPSCPRITNLKYCIFFSMTEKYLQTHLQICKRAQSKSPYIFLFDHIIVWIKWNCINKIHVVTNQMDYLSTDYNL